MTAIAKARLVNLNVASEVEIDQESYDIVMNVYTDSIENDKIDSEEEFIHLIYIQINELYRVVRGNGNAFLNEEKKCAKCKSILPASSFFIVHNNRYNGEYISSYCVECNRDHVKEWYEKSKSDERIAGLIKSRKSRYKKKNALELSDSYILPLLLRKYSIEEICNNDKLIDYHRYRIISSRLRRRKKISESYLVEYLDDLVVSPMPKIFKMIFNG